MSLSLVSFAQQELEVPIMATTSRTQTQTASKSLVTITELDHIVLRVKDVEVSMQFYTETLGLKPDHPAVAATLHAEQ